MKPVLVVDDNVEQLQLRQAVLELAGFSVWTASCAGEALARSHGCGAVVMDLRMPKLQDGLGLIRTLQERHPEAPIVVLAGLPEELAGKPESKLVHRVVRKGSGTGVIIDVLLSLGSIFSLNDEPE